LGKQESKVKLESKARQVLLEKQAFRARPGLLEKRAFKVRLA
jgi:hypothetical protein